MKAQVISMDLFLAIIILLSIIGGLAYFMIDFVDLYEQQAINREMQIRGQAAINALLNPPEQQEENNNSNT